jgi:oligopeptide transport system substrate-binding protein
MIAVLGLAAIAMAAGCRSATQPDPRHTLSFYIAEPAYIDPYNAQESEGVQVINDVFDSLVDFNPITSDIMPSVAESWTPSNDFQTWTFKLKHGTKFHNGREVKAQDFVYAWNRIAAPTTQTVNGVPVAPSTISYHLAPIKGFDKSQNATGALVPLEGLRALDDYTLQVDLAYPFADFQYVVGHPALAPVPKEAVEQDPAAFSEKPVGNGPFMMAEPWRHNQYIRVVRFPDYFGRKATIDGVMYKIFKDEQTAFLEFKAGTVDFTKSIPTGQIRTTVAAYGQSTDGYTARPGGGVVLGAETSTYYLNINNYNEMPAAQVVKPLTDPRVRAAISLAINREVMVKTIYEGTRKPATGLVPPGVVGFLPNQGKYCHYDVAAARKLLADAGYPGGKGLPTIDLSFNSGSGHEAVMQQVQANLKDIGIDSKLDGMEWAQFLKFRQDGKHEIARDGWIFDYPIIDNMLYPLFYSKNVGKDNSSRYVNLTFDALVLKARRTNDVGARLKLYQEAERTILDEAGAVPLTFYAHRGVARPRVVGLVYSPLGLVNSNMISLTQGPAK